MRFSGKDAMRTLYGRAHEAKGQRRRTGTEGREEERAGAESGGDGEQCYGAQPSQGSRPPQGCDHPHQHGAFGQVSEEARGVGSLWNPVRGISLHSIKVACP